jgi:hypothetical protein
MIINALWHQFAKPANRFKRSEIYSQPQKIILLCGAYL